MNNLVNLIRYGSKVIYSKARGGARKYVPHDLDGCKLYLPMEEKTINLSLDHSGLNNHATIYGAIEYEDIDNGLSFNGVDDYGDVGKKVEFNFTEVTIMVWIRPIGVGSSSGYSRIVEKYYTNSYYLGLNDDDTKLKACFYKPATPYGNIESSTIINYGTKYHVVATHDGINDCLYVNGAREIILPNTDVLSNTTHDIHIGTNANINNQFFNGIIYSIKIYNRALTPSQILSAYQQEL